MYAIQHNVTKRVYVGSSSNLKERLKAHMRMLRGGRHIQNLMQEEYDRYGEDYTFYLLHEGDMNKREMLEIEYLYMTVFKSRDPRFGYNLKEETKDHKLEDCTTVSQDFSTIMVEKAQRKRASARAVARPLK